MEQKKKQILLERQRFQKLAGINTTETDFLLEFSDFYESLENRRDDLILEAEEAQSGGGMPTLPNDPAKLVNVKAFPNIEKIEQFTPGKGTKLPTLKVKKKKNPNAKGTDSGTDSSKSSSGSVSGGGLSSNSSSSKNEDKQQVNEMLDPISWTLAAPMLAQGAGKLADWIADKVSVKKMSQQKAQDTFKQVLQDAKDLQKRVDKLPRDEKVSPETMNEINNFIKKEFEFHKDGEDHGKVHELKTITGRKTGSEYFRDKKKSSSSSSSSQTDADMEKRSASIKKREEDERAAIGKVPIHLRGKWQNKVFGDKFMGQLQNAFNKPPQSEKDFFVTKDDTNYDADLKCQMLVSSVDHHLDVGVSGSAVGRFFRKLAHKAHDGYIDAVGTTIGTVLKLYISNSYILYNPETKKLEQAVKGQDEMKDVSAQYSTIHKYLSNEQYRKSVNTILYCVLAIGWSAKHVAEIGKEAYATISGNEGALETVAEVGGEAAKGVASSMSAGVTNAITAAKSGKTGGEVIRALFNLT
jgi:hypothetical protein